MNFSTLVLVAIAVVLCMSSASLLVAAADISSSSSNSLVFPKFAGASLYQEDTPLTTTDNNNNSFPLRIPTGLCTEDMFPFNSVLNDTKLSKTYFMSYDLCKRTNLTAAFVNDLPCGYGEFQIEQVDGTKSKFYNNTKCGRVFDNHTVLSRNDSLLVARYFINSQPNSINDNYLELVMYCIPAAIDVVTWAPNINHVQWNAKSVIVNATGVCQDLPPPSGPGGDEGTSPGVYAAIACVLTFVAIFATVLYRAKMAGDKLRELKRARGERAFLG